MTDIEKEKLKLRANYLNGIALIFIGLGGLGPFFQIVDGFESWKEIIYALVWLWAGGMSSWEVHRLAQKTLEKIE